MGTSRPTYESIDLHRKRHHTYPRCLFFGREDYDCKILFSRQLFTLVRCCQKALTNFKKAELKKFISGPPSNSKSVCSLLIGQFSVCSLFIGQFTNSKLTTTLNLEFVAYALKLLDSDLQRVKASEGLQDGRRRSRMVEEKGLRQSKKEVQDAMK